MPKKKILVISLDYDGCYSYLDFYRDFADHYQFHQFLVKTIETGGYDEVVLMNGSKRQSREADVYVHTAHFQNGSFTQSLPYALQFLTQRLNVPVSINPWIIEDVVMGFSQPEQFYKHKAFVDTTIPRGSKMPNLPRHYTDITHGKAQASKQFSLHNDKTTILLFQNHLAGQIDPEATIHVLFVDDNAKFISNNFKQIVSVDTLIPNNVELQFIEYCTGGRAVYEGQRICGTGLNCLDEIKHEIEEQVRQHKKNEFIDEEKMIQCVRDAKISRPNSKLANLSLFSAEAKDALEVKINLVNTQSTELKVAIKPR
jgi:hypothetical protein